MNNLCGCECGGHVKKNNKYIHGHFWRGRKHSENSKEKIRQGNLGKKRSENTKKEMSERVLGKNNPFFGKYHSEETKKRLSELAKNRPLLPKEEWWKYGNPGKKHPLYGKQHSEETRKKQSDISKEQYKNGRINPFKGKKHSEETKRKMSDRRKELWKDLEFRDKMVKKMMMLGQNSPNKSEQKLWNFLNENWPNKWDFVGDGKLIINGRCPDFVNTERNLIIEMFGDYWHQNENPSDRARLFEPDGYKTLVIWESEMKKSMVDVGNKIQEFVEVE